MRRLTRSFVARLGPEGLAALLTIPVVLVFVAVLFVLVASSR